MHEIFPEVEAARSWLAGSRLPRDARDDGDEPLQLYIAGTRCVLLCFSFDEPWIVGDYAHSAAYFFDEAVRPALAEYERAARLFDPFDLP